MKRSFGLTFHEKMEISGTRFVLAVYSACFDPPDSLREVQIARWVAICRMWSTFFGWTLNTNKKHVTPESRTPGSVTTQGDDVQVDLLPSRTENNKKRRTRERHVSSVDHCQPYTKKKRSCVCVCYGISRVNVPAAVHTQQVYTPLCRTVGRKQKQK